VYTVPVAARADLTDAQWALQEPLLPKGKKPGRPPKWTRRQLINGIRWRARVGPPWRDVAQEPQHRAKPPPSHCLTTAAPAPRGEEHLNSLRRQLGRRAFFNLCAACGR